MNTFIVLLNGRRNRVGLIIGLMAVASAPKPVTAQCLPEEFAKLTAMDGAASDNFGRSVAVSGNTAIIGAPLDDHAGGINAGAAYVFVKSNGVWLQQAKLVASDAAANDMFGYSVAIDGETALIGAYQDDHFGSLINAGSAYVFVRNGDTWTQQAKLLPINNSSSSGAFFGFSVSLSGETAVIGAYLADIFNGVTDTGAAYVFVRSGTTWTRETIVYNPEPAMIDGFGYSVSVFGNGLIVGCPQDDSVVGGDAGSAFVYGRSGSAWDLETKLIPTNVDAGARFGTAVSLGSNCALVGAPFHSNASGLPVGMAFVFCRSDQGWSEQSLLTAIAPSASDQFGNSVALLENVAIVGALGDRNVGGIGAGSAVVFARIGDIWMPHAEMLASDGSEYDNFGVSVAISETTALIGARAEDNNGGTDAGSAYVFYGGSDECDGDGLSDQDDNCPFIWNASQVDGDSDSIGDACDNCVDLANQDQGDEDADQIGDLCDICTDTDGDGFGNPGFAANTCVQDDCPETPSLNQSDSDGDGVSDSCDNCAEINNSGQEDADQDGVGDVCDCVGVENAILADLGDPVASDYLGSAVAIDGDTAVVAAFADDHAGGVNAGSVFVFVRSGASWVQQAFLTASDAAAQELFGDSVAIEGDTLIVGGAREDNQAGVDAGSAYIFVRNNGVWTEQAKLVASDSSPNDWFGVSVGVSGDTVVIGARQDNPSTMPQAGSAYVFVRQGTFWTQQAKLVASDATNGDLFGGAVAIYEDTILIGARNDTINGHVRAGSAYIFTRQAGVWTQRAKLFAADAEDNSEYGTSVALHGNIALIGAYGDSIPFYPSAGSAYVFEGVGESWEQRAKLVATDPSARDLFGTSVALTSTKAIVGAWSGNLGGISGGSAYLYSHIGGVWNQIAKIAGSDTDLNDSFALSVGISDNFVIAGAFQNDVTGITDAGSAYIFEFQCDDFVDSDEDGIADDSDICPNNAPNLPIDCNGRPLRDANNDCLLNTEDIPIIVDELLFVTPAFAGCNGHPLRDANGDTVLDGADISLLVSELLGQ